MRPKGGSTMRREHKGEGEREDKHRKVLSARDGGRVHDGLPFSRAHGHTMIDEPPDLLHITASTLLLRHAHHLQAVLPQPLRHPFVPDVRRIAGDVSRREAAIGQRGHLFRLSKAVSIISRAVEEDAERSRLAHRPDRVRLFPPTRRRRRPGQHVSGAPTAGHAQERWATLTQTCVAAPCGTSFENVIQPWSFSAKRSRKSSPPPWCCEMPWSQQSAIYPLSLPGRPR